ncbi:alpha/beta-hydrolase [Corynespora cassiicola Philippines]|uniref:feruloyl esterase n=1 Tax=Corynespora cassiicola Philippines TaxID=1448308 RepID=A0A2T2NZT1_CORCC|nr:alpha/beta-hydrolase [Corynespora cassiicola Philippines]
MLAQLILLPTLLSIAANASPTQTAKKSSACDKPLPEGIELGKHKNLTLASESGQSPREYRIHVPKSYQTGTPVPLILSYHGRTQDMKYQQQLSQFSNSSYGFEGIAVYPQGVRGSDKNVTQWQGDPDAPDSIDDIKFTMELLDELENSYCIDTSLVYAAGKSNGGGFAGGVLPCDEEVSKRFAAFAAVSGAFYLDNKTQQLPPCNPGRRVTPIIEFHGLKDNTIKYDGGNNTRGNANTTSIVDWINDWAERDGLEPNANSTKEFCSDRKKVTKFTWDEKETVAHYTYKNLYHDWPSSFANDDTSLTTCKEVEATRVILDWFARWSV